MRLTALMLLIILPGIPGCGSTVDPVSDEYVPCRILSGERSAVRVLRWKFDAVARTLPQLPLKQRVFPLQELEKLAAERLPASELDSMPNADDTIRQVLLELEVRGSLKTERTAQQPLGM